MRRLIRWIAMLSVLGAGAWSLWWYAGARGQETGVAAWLDNQRERGWQAEASDIAVEGYPMDFRLRAVNLALADPRNGWSWQAPVLEAESRAYEPTRIAVRWPPEHSVAVPGDRAEIRSEKMETLLDLRPGPSMELRQAATDVERLMITGRTGWRAGADGLAFNLSEKPAELGPPNSYDLDLEAIALVLPRQVIDRIDPTGWLKPKVDRFTVRGHGAFDEPLARATIETGQVALRAATIREAGFEWGEMRLYVRGDFKVDEDGFPEGKIEVEAREWRQMIRLAVHSDLIDRDTAKSIIKAIEFVTALTGSGDDLSAPFGLSGGKIRIGPFAVADAPRLAPPRW